MGSSFFSLKAKRNVDGVLISRYFRTPISSSPPPLRLLVLLLAFAVHRRRPFSLHSNAISSFSCCSSECLIYCRKRYKIPHPTPPSLFLPVLGTYIKITVTALLLMHNNKYLMFYIRLNYQFSFSWCCALWKLKQFETGNNNGKEAIDRYWCSELQINWLQFNDINYEQKQLNYCFNVMTCLFRWYVTIVHRRIE